jgi:transposase
VKKDTKVSVAVGLDVSDRWTVLCAVEIGSGEVLERSRLRTSEAALRRRFEGVEPMRIALEVGPHSPWISRLLEQLGHEVLVANAAKVALIHRNDRKHDRADAETLARLAAFDPKLLFAIRHRGEQAQHDLAVIRSRDLLVRSRTQLIAHVRGAVKAVGHRLESCQAECFGRRVEDQIPPGLRPALAPVLAQIATLTEAIRDYDRRIEQLAKQHEIPQLLRQVQGVGALTALTYVLVIEDPTRFAHSRSVGPYLGLVPRLDASGDSSPELRITKVGDALLRRLLVNCAHYILGPFGPDCDLRRYGQRLQGRGGKLAKKKAVIAVARKLAVLLHRLWITGEEYDPFYTARQKGEAPQEQGAA